MFCCIPDAHEEFNFVRRMLSKFACFRNKNPYIRCFLTVLITLCMQFMINLLCPVFTNNLLPYCPTNFNELLIKIFVVEIVILFFNMVLYSICKSSTNPYFRFTMIILSIALIIYQKFYNSCATLLVIFSLSKEVKQLY